MDKAQFLEELKRRLSGLPQSELEERLLFYSEMIDDRVEDGLTEEEAVAGIGSVDALVEQIMTNRFDDSQLAEADISIRDINSVKESFKRYLQQIYHARIAYPKRQKPKA